MSVMDVMDNALWKNKSRIKCSHGRGLPARLDDASHCLAKTETTANGNY